MQSTLPHPGAKTIKRWRLPIIKASQPPRLDRLPGFNPISPITTRLGRSSKPYLGPSIANFFREHDINTQHQHDEHTNFTFLRQRA